MDQVDIPALIPRTCKICKLDKYPHEFYKTSKRCRKCATIQARESWQKNNPHNSKYPKIGWLD